MISVAAFVDLHRRPGAGGHVKSWEHFAEAAVGLEGELDLTVHVLGEGEGRTPLGPNVRYVSHPPVFSTERLGFFEETRDHTDLAPLNLRLLPTLERYDVLHTTHPLFAFGRTALLHARWKGTPLVSSVHTDVAAYAEIYADQALRRLFGGSWVGRLLVDRLELPRRRRRAMKRALRKHWSRCARVLVSRPDDFGRVAEVVGEDRVSHLRRGIDRDTFDSERADRDWIARRHGVPEGHTVLLFVGRIDPSKSALTFARAVRDLSDRGRRVHGLMVGEGSEAEDAASTLGKAGTLTGVLSPEELGRVFASADAFVFPSATEIYPNVVVEARVCGLPVVVSGRGGASQLVEAPGIDGVVVHDPSTRAWADAVDSLISDPGAMARMGAAARQRVERSAPTWEEVLREDLVPVWQAAAGRSIGGPPPPLSPSPPDRSTRSRGTRRRRP